MTNEVRIEHQRMIKIALNDTNRRNFDLFENIFRDLLSKGKISSRDIRYSSQRPFSCVVSDSLKDEVLKLAEKLPTNIIELSEYDLDTETGEIIDGSHHILFPRHNNELDSYEEEIKSDKEYGYADDDDDDDNDLNDLNGSGDDDDDDENYDWYHGSSGDDYYITSSTNTSTSTSNTTNIDFISNSEPTRIENSVGGLSIDDLLPTADDIISNLSPVITGLPVTTNKDIIYTTNQYQSSIYTLYGLLGKSLANVKPSDLEREIKKFKNNLHAGFIPEVNAYFNSQNKYDSKVEELNNTSDHIKSQSEENFRLWLENQIQLLKAEYAKTNPDNTDEQIAYYLAENKPILDNLEHELFENKAKAKQALVREFTAHNGSDALSDALRFVMVKELSKEAINNLMSLYENNSEGLASPPSPPSPAVQTKVTGNTTPVTMLSTDQFIDDRQEDVVNTDGIDTPKNFADIDLTQISDDDLIKMYEQEMSGRVFTDIDDDDDNDNFLGNNEPREDENTYQSSNNFDDTDEIKIVSLTDNIGEVVVVEDDKTNDLVEDISSDDSSDGSLDDSIDIGQTGDIPLISLEDLESADHSIELADDDISNIELNVRNDEPDLLVNTNKSNESTESEEFKYIEEDDFSIEEIENSDDKTGNSKKRKDKKSKNAKNSKKSKKSDKLDKTKKSGLKTWIVGGVIALVLAGVGGGTYLLLNQNTEPSQSQEAQQAEQRKQAEEFFNSIKDYIAVDKSILIPINDENVEVTIVALNVDGSILVEDADGNQHTVSYDAVKAYAEDMKSKSESE